MKILTASGFRKRARARAQLVEGSGKIKVNRASLDTYGSDMTRMRIQEPLMIVPDVSSKVDITVDVVGGGQSGQTDAVRLAIGRVLSLFGGEKVRKALIDYDRSLIVADTRRKETRKPNDSKARAARQKSYR